MQQNNQHQFSIFGMKIDNVSMQDAVESVVTPRADRVTKTVCFVNANSINLARDNEGLTHAVNDADCVFADGSGVRLAARRAGITLQDNVNGTDMLPLLCEKAAAESLSIFFLGAAPGVAEQAASNLTERFKGLRVAGTQHGYFSNAENPNIIKAINASGADILLVAFGSPNQEAWLQNNRQHLKVKSALAVGGLFDFYSGRIPRAPLWMRRTGIEWIWRLMQEPKAKFKRYVIGNPLFIYRCWKEIPKTASF